jgi:hypothetical protein
VRVPIARRANREQPRASARLQPWDDVPERVALIGRRLRPPNVKNTRARVESAERAAEWPASFPEITFVESDSMAFQKLTKLFLIRKFAVMLGLSGNVGGDSLYVRLAH